MKTFLCICIFSVLPSILQAQSIVAAEYFINTDPGQGNGAPTPVTANGTSIEVSVNPSIIAALPNGFHQLAVRVQNDSGNWAISFWRTFEKRAPEQAPEPGSALATIEYRWYQNNEAVSEPNSLTVAAGQASASFEQLASLAGLTEGGDYQLVFTPVDSAGNRGISHTRLVTVQTTDENGNGLPDLWERNFAVTNPSEDKDGDGVTNLDEFLNKTNPNLEDSDNDGINDRAEIDLRAAGLAFDPVTPNSALAMALRENANGSGLYNLNQFQLFAGGVPVIERTGSGPLILKFQIKSSDDLQTFQKLPLPEGSLIVTDDDEIEYQITPEVDVKFYSVTVE